MRSVSFDAACQYYEKWGVSVKDALETMSKVSISLHCWQGDDVGGFESSDGLQGGGILATGNYLGKARTADELRQDAEQAFSMIPGKHRFSLHAIYLENGGQKVERDDIEPAHFQRWIDWAKEQELGLDFNPTFFSHPLANDGFTLSSANEQTRKFWIRHGIQCRKIAAEFGRQLGSPAIVNFWMPDGYKDLPIDRLSPRIRMKESLDTIFAENISSDWERDAVESKLFGIGSESYVVGSHEFFIGYALQNHKLLCLDSGHFHPTETIADKLSGLSLFVPEFLLHVSRGVRWDSDHVVIWNDELKAIAEELVRNDLLDRVHIGLDYFDATVNRIAAWVIGTRAMLRALLVALLEPVKILRELELQGDWTGRLAMLEELRAFPFAEIWNEYCRQNQVPVGSDWLNAVRKYEADVLSKRS